MREEIKTLKEDYKSFKSNKDSLLDMSQLKDVVKFRVKLKRTINELEETITALDKAQEYGQTISTARAKLKKELKELLVLKQTL